VTPNVRIDADTQTAYVLALMFDLLPEEQRPVAARRLAEDIRARDDHLSTGFVGTPYLCHVLSRHGYLDIAYALLVQESYPSWLYPVRHGATTIWERWDGIKPDGSFQDESMNSFNHYAYGAIGDWMVCVVAGLEVDPAAPGYKHTLVEPHPGGGLTSARASLQSMYGEVTSAWELQDGGLRLSMTIPANTTAAVRLPAARLAQVSEGGKPLDVVAGVVHAEQDEDAVTLEIGAGAYEFTYPTDAFQTGETPRRFTLQTPLSTLLSHEGARAVLAAHVPGMLDHPLLSQAMGYSLVQIAAFVPDQLSDETLAAIDADLAEL
jgi:alpha-L-rhamnosidase